MGLWPDPIKKIVMENARQSIQKKACQTLQKRDVLLRRRTFQRYEN